MWALYPGRIGTWGVGFCGGWNKASRPNLNSRHIGGRRALSPLRHSEFRSMTFTSRLFKKKSLTEEFKEYKNVEGKKNQATAENVNFIFQIQERPRFLLW